MSKSYGLAGLRVGWLAMKESAMLKQIAAQKDYATISNSAPSEVFAIIALRARVRLIERSMRIIRSNLAVLDPFLSKWSDRITCVRPRAGAIAFPKLRAREQIADVAARLVNSHGVLLLPVDVFDYPGNHFRIGFGRENFPEALARFDDFLATIG